MPPVGMVTRQLGLVPPPVVHPCQSRKLKPELGEAVSSTEAPMGTMAMHETEGQLIPYVRLVTVPDPLGVI